MKFPKMPKIAMPRVPTREVTIRVPDVKMPRLPRIRITVERG